MKRCGLLDNPYGGSNEKHWPFAPLGLTAVRCRLGERPSENRNEASRDRRCSEPGCWPSLGLDGRNAIDPASLAFGVGLAR